MADTKISAFTDGTNAVSTDRIPIARSPYGSTDNYYITPSYINALVTPTTLGLVIGTDVQAYDAQLASIAGLSYSGNALKVIRVNAGETAFELATNSASVAWGGVTGTLSDQTDLQSALDAKAPLTSPTFATSVTISYGTASELLATDASKNVVSLDTATYPSLTELSYVKGVTSAIQTQINAKAPSTSPTFATSVTCSYLTASTILSADGSKNIVSLSTSTYPSLTELSYLKGVTSAVQSQLDGKADLPTVSTQTTTAYTAVIGDANTVVQMSNTGAMTFTIPPNSSVAFDTGTWIEIHQANSGTVTVAAGAGVTLKSRGSLVALAGQEAVAGIRKIATDTWRLTGDIA